VDQQVALMAGRSHLYSNLTYYNIAERVFYRVPIAGNWHLVEEDGGRIELAGRYTAPLKSGVFHLEATAMDYPGLRARVEVKVGYYQWLLSYNLRRWNSDDQGVIRDASTWDVWKAAHVDPGTQDPDEAIDFSRFNVVWVTRTFSACDLEDVVNVVPVGDTLQVIISHRKWSGSGGTGTCGVGTLTPVWLLMVPKSDLKLSVVIQEIRS
jgi:hypothetical protein